MNKRCVYSFFLNTVLVMCIMTISSEGELELVGLRLRKPLFLWSALCNHKSRELYGGGRDGALTHFVFVNGGCNLFIDAGTRVHLLDAKGLSFTQNVFICICYCLRYIWILGQHIKIQWPVMSWKYLFLPLPVILHSVGQFEQLLHLIWIVINWTKSVDLQL